MNFFIVQMRKLRLIDDKSLGESQSSWWSRDQTQEAAWLQSFVPPPPHQPQPPATICCPWCKAPLPSPIHPHVWKLHPDYRRHPPPGILLSQDTEEQPRQCPPCRSSQEGGSGQVLG